MPREYRHIKEYEAEIMRLREKGLTLRAIGEQLGFTYKQMHNFITRCNENHRKVVAGIHFYNNERIQLKTKLTPMKFRNQFIA
jgi:lambda repressor-like predicted transcriptional regulator